jgi:hypothetical protein
MTRLTRIRNRFDARGQSMLEFALILPLILMVLLGVIEVGYALLDKHVITKLTREGSNLISRETALGDAATALTNMSTRPVNFTDGTSKVIFSVLKNVDAVGAPNFGKVVLYARHSKGGAPGTSQLKTQAANPAMGPGPEYTAMNADGDGGLVITNMPAGLTISPGGMLYVTEIYTKHDMITPFDKFGVALPKVLYSIAWF